MQKVRYEVDPYNRLVVRRPGRPGKPEGSAAKTGLNKFRRVLDGRFRTDGHNELSYDAKAPLSSEEDIPHRVRLKGAWSLTDDHTLRLTLEKLGRQTCGDELTLEGRIIDVRGNELLFAVTTTTLEDARSTYVLTLGGSWQADDRNRLTFAVRKEGGKVDILTFTGAWELDKNNRIIYQYEKAALIRKKRETHTLTFKGCWQIGRSGRLSYAMSADTGSVFNFSASASVFKEDRIQYELGMGLTERGKPLVRTIRIFGAWNLLRDVGLTFEVEYENGRAAAIVFGAQASLTDNDTVSFKLRDAVEDRDVGITLELSRKILKGDGEAFLRMLASGREASICAGAAWRW